MLRNWRWPYVIPPLHAISLDKHIVADNCSGDDKGAELLSSGWFDYELVIGTKRDGWKTDEVWVGFDLLGSFDCASRDEAARSFAQDDDFKVRLKVKLK